MLMVGDVDSVFILNKEFKFPLELKENMEVMVNELNQLSGSGQSVVEFVYDAESGSMNEGSVAAIARRPFESVDLFKDFVVSLLLLYCFKKMNN